MALVKYYKFCFLGYITYLQNLGHNPFSPFSTSRLCLLSIFNINLGNKVHSEMRAQWYSTNVYCLLETVIHCEHQSLASYWLKHVVKDNYRARARVTDSNTTTTPKPLLTIRRQQALGILCSFFVLFYFLF